LSKEKKKRERWAPGEHNDRENQLSLNS